MLMINQPASKLSEAKGKNKQFFLLVHMQKHRTQTKQQRDRWRKALNHI